MPHCLQSLLMSARVLITWKQPRTLSSESPLIPKRLDGDLGQRNLGDPVFSLRVRNPHDRVFQVHLILLHLHQLLVDPKAGLGVDPDDVSKVLRSLELNLLLFGPANVMRPEKDPSPRPGTQPRHTDSKAATSFARPHSESGVRSEAPDERWLVSVSLAGQHRHRF